MKSYLVERVAIVNGVKDISYIGKDYSSYNNIRDFAPVQFFSRKNEANACLYRFMYGSSNCEVLDIKVIEVNGLTYDG